MWRAEPVGNRPRFASPDRVPGRIGARTVPPPLPSTTRAGSAPADPPHRPAPATAPAPSCSRSSSRAGGIGSWPFGRRSTPTLRCSSCLSERARLCNRSPSRCGHRWWSTTDRAPGRSRRRWTSSSHAGSRATSASCSGGVRGEAGPARRWSWSNRLWFSTRTYRHEVRCGGGGAAGRGAGDAAGQQTALRGGGGGPGMLHGRGAASAGAGVLGGLKGSRRPSGGPGPPHSVEELVGRRRLQQRVGDAVDPLRVGPFAHQLGQSRGRFLPEPAGGLTSKKPKLALLDPLLDALLDALSFPLPHPPSNSPAHAPPDAPLDHLVQALPKPVHRLRHRRRPSCCQFHRVASQV